MLLGGTIGPLGGVAATGLPGTDLGAVGVGGCGNGCLIGADDTDARLLGVKRGTALPGVDGTGLPGVEGTAGLPGGGGGIGDGGIGIDRLPPEDVCRFMLAIDD